MSKTSKAKAGYIQLADADHFTSFGFWKPGMQRVYAKVRNLLQEMGLRFQGTDSKELLVHPDDFAQANAVLLCTERTELPFQVAGH